MRDKKILNMVYTALFTAMIFVLTRFLPIPIAASGYVHFGDALLYVVSCILGGPYAMLAGAVSAALADVTSGFAFYAPASIVIKIFIALPFTINAKKREKILTPTTALLTVPAGLITVGGYFLADLVINKAYAYVNIPGNAVQAVGSAVIFIVLGAAFDAADIKKKLFRG